MKIPPDPATFLPGVYRHYKGLYYTALHIARHHEAPDPTHNSNGTVTYPAEHCFVVYYCSEQKTLNVREWAKPGADSWTDEIDLGNGLRALRFEYVGPAL